MYKNFTGETPIAALTVSQFKEVLGNDKAPETAPMQTTDYTRRYVHGLKGIQQLFGVSHATAQRYKDTFLKPAIKQNGRVIVIDVERALELFDEQQAKGR
jgi:hypothetical protein